MHKIRTIIILILILCPIGRVHYYAKMSNYWPPEGGNNCSKFVDGECVSKTASGENWYDWINTGCACPPEYPFYTKFIINGETWTCIDRGSAIVKISGNIFWLDLLTPYKNYSYGELVEVKIK